MFHRLISGADSKLLIEAVLVCICMYLQYIYLFRNKKINICYCRPYFSRIRVVSPLLLSPPSRYDHFSVRLGSFRPESFYPHLPEPFRPHFSVQSLVVFPMNIAFVKCFEQMFSCSFSRRTDTFVCIVLECPISLASVLSLIHVLVKSTRYTDHGPTTFDHKLISTTILPLTLFQKS